MKISSYSLRCGPVFLVIVGVFVGLFGLSLPLSAQDEERPDVHADFQYGVFPYEADALERFATEDARMLISGLHKGWNVDKYIKESEIPDVEVLTLLDELEDARLIRGQTDYDMRPGFPVFREDGLAETAGLISDTAVGMADLIEREWGMVDDLVASLEAGSDLPRGEIIYRAVVGGLLFGGMIETLTDDKTLMPGAPRRASRNDAYYAWMTEGDSGPEHLVWQSASVGRHQVYSIGTVAQEDPRVQISILAETDPVYEYDDARRWRVFANVMSRDYLLPYLKTRRSELLELHSDMDASNYSAFGEFIAWFYISAASEAADVLVQRGRLSGPETSFRYALRTDR
jgi:hypothetical protein